MDFYPAPLRGGDRDASPGAGKEAERRYQSPAWKAYRLHPSLSETPSADLGFHLLTWVFGPSGALESALAVSRVRARTGSRVSSGAKRRASHGDRKENDCPRPPVSDEGGDRRQAGHLGAGERSVRRSRSRLRISPRTGASARSEVAPGAGKEQKTGGPWQSARSVCLPTARSTKQKRMSGASEGRGAIRGKARGPAVGAKRRLPGPGKTKVPSAGWSRLSPRSGRQARPEA